MQPSDSQSAVVQPLGNKHGEGAPPLYKLSLTDHVISAGLLRTNLPVATVPATPSGLSSTCSTQRRMVLAQAGAPARGGGEGAADKQR